MLSRMAPSSPPAMRTLHLLKTPDILLLDSAEFAVSIMQRSPLNPNEYRSACKRRERIIYSILMTSLNDHARPEDLGDDSGSRKLELLVTFAYRKAIFYLLRGFT